MLKKPSARRATGLLGLAALLLAPGLASALSLGEPRLESQYGQPLRLRLPVELVTEEEQTDAGLLRARLMGEDHYEAESAALPEIPLNELEVETQQAEGRRWVVISSRRSLREPMLTLFVNVRLGASQLTREIPVLLDFPTPRRAPPPAAPPAGAPAPATTAPVASQAPEPSSVATPVPPTATAVVGIDAAEPAPPPASPPRRRRALAASEASPILRWPERPAGYSRLRFDEQLTSLGRIGSLPSPAAVAVAPGPAPAVLPPPSSPPEPAADIPASVDAPAPTPAAGEADAGGWSWGWLLAGLALLAAIFVWRRRRTARSGDAPVPVKPEAARSASTVPATAAAVAPFAAAEPDARPAPEWEPLVAATVPVAAAFESPLDLADPTDFGLDPGPAEDTAGVASRDRYPNQALRERVTQLSRLVGSAAERRKLELVKAYIDVDRTESAEKLLAELEAKYPVYGRPDTVDFELV